MSFTERDFILLNDEDKLKKIVFAIKQYLNEDKKIDYINSLFDWYNKSNHNKINMPADKNEWDILYNDLYDKLLIINPYLENEIFDISSFTGKIEPFNLSVIIDNIRSPFNVGSILRTSEALGVKEVFICGISPKTDNKQVLKTSRNIKIKTNYFKSTIEAIEYLKNIGNKIFAIEKTKNSSDISQCRFNDQCSLIFGNEEFGISKNILDNCDGIYHIPMFGYKKSINVSAACGIAIFEIIKNNYNF